MILWRDARMFVLFTLLLAGVLGLSAAHYFGVEISFQKLAGELSFVRKQPEARVSGAHHPVRPAANPVLHIDPNPVSPFAPLQG